MLGERLFPGRSTKNLVILSLVAAGVAGCSGSDGTGPPGGSRPPQYENLPSNPSAFSSLTFRQETLAATATSDGADYRDDEFNAHWGLAAIKADAAYQRGYFGQGATVAIMDDGMDLNHPDLIGKTYSPWDVAARNTIVTEVEQFHGTYVGILVAGSRGNTAATFAAVTDSGLTIATKNSHGVAPQASLIPIQTYGGGQPEDAISYATAQKAHIINGSIGLGNSLYWGRMPGREGVWLFAGPVFTPMLLDARLRRGTQGDLVLNSIDQAAAAMRNADTVMVWAAGNEGWNSQNPGISACVKDYHAQEGCLSGQGEISKQELFENFIWIPGIEDDILDEIVLKDLFAANCPGQDCIEYNVPDIWIRAPLLYPELLGKWLSVGATSQDGSIASFSNGCGSARNWCLFAPGEDLELPWKEGTISGTSFSAPIASGALALLKSRLPNMSMETLLAILLVSADPKGARIDNPDTPDAVYGWGLINVERAIAMQEQVRLPSATLSNATITTVAALASRPMSLAGGLAHLHDDLASIEMAAGTIGNAYYNMKMTDFVTGSTDRTPRSGQLRPGSAASNMLAATGDARIVKLALRSRQQQLQIAADWQRQDIGLVRLDFAAGRLGRWRLEQRACEDCLSFWTQDRSGFNPADTAAATGFFTRTGTALFLHKRGNAIEPFAAAGRTAANGKPWRQFGLRMAGGHNRIGLVAELAQVREADSLWGSDLAGFGKTQTVTWHRRLLATSALAGNWRGFLDYQNSAAQVAVSDTPAAAISISGLRAQQWAAGVAGRDLFAGGDLLRMSIWRPAAISRGKMHIDHLVAGGSSFAEAFYNKKPQHLQMQRSTIDMRSPTAFNYLLGYSRPVAAGTRIAVAAQYDGRSRAAEIGLRITSDF